MCNGIVSGRTGMLLLLLGYSMLPINYLASFLFGIPASGYQAMLYFGFAAGLTPMMVLQMMSMKGTNMGDVTEWIQTAFLIFPYYCLTSGIQNLYLEFSSQKLCNTARKNCRISGMDEQKCRDLICDTLSQCCSKYKIM